MEASPDEWTFGDAIDPARLVYLEDPLPFDQQIEQLSSQLEEPTLIEYWIETGDRGRAMKCIRPVFHLRVSNNLSDMFYNARTGYRAQFYIDPMDGQNWNRWAIDYLIDRLVKITEIQDPIKGTNTLTIEQVRMSLAAASAKMWIFEKDSDGNKIVGKSNPELVYELFVPRWWPEARTAVEENRDSKALDGILAPLPWKLDIKGGFLDQKEWTERVPVDKVDRAIEIHRYGFT